MGKSKIVSAVLYEAKELVKVMKKQAGVPAPLPEALTPAVINVLWQMIASKRYDLDDQEVIGFERLIQKAQESSARLSIQDIFPWIKNILPETIFNYIIKKHNYSQISTIDEHLKILDKNNPRDFIDDYLIEMDKQKNNPDSTMSNLVGCIGDLFTAGLETTSMTINWIVFYLATFPHVQKKLHEEIDEVLPKGTVFTLELKSRLPYTEAFSV
ncbi:Cytochrome P450 2L1 [Armadillidium nasatum]|uniref:Cytochrome P450 2L1 n=1 Tax=Armadillidium nasatum TaxID=96803 RepID=A0A5N5TFJ2_9CRUS|nr:Cytochrome P450 2L1 [Armadillidium nasatum]